MLTTDILKTKPLYILTLANAIYDTRPMPADAPPADADIMVAAGRIAKLMREAEELEQALRNAAAKVNEEGEAYKLKTLLKEAAATALAVAVTHLKDNCTFGAESIIEWLEDEWKKPEQQRVNNISPRKWRELAPLSDAHASQYYEIFSEIIRLLERHGEAAAPPVGGGGSDGDGVGKLEHKYTPHGSLKP